MQRDPSNAAPASSPAAALDVDIYCPRCGYDLRGLGAGSCPECGERFDPVELRRSQIPWTWRGEGGWLRRTCRAYFCGYWPTVWMVMFRNKRFCREVAKPTSFRDARWFQIVTVLHLFVPWAIYVTAACLFSGASMLEWALASVWPFAAGLALAFVFLLLATGVHTYWFHPRSLPLEKQNRAVALAYYCCAPLAWAPVLGVIGLVFAWRLSLEPDMGLRGNGPGVLAISLWVLFLIITITIVTEFWWLPVLSAGRIAGRGLAGRIALGLALPVLWLLLGFFLLVLIPGSMFWLWLVRASVVQ